MLKIKNPLSNHEKRVSVGRQVLERILITLTRDEFDPLFFGDEYCFTRLRVSSLPSLAVFDLETPEPGEGDSFPRSQRFLNRLHHCFEGLVSLKVGDPRILGHLGQDFLFGHFKPPGVFPMLGR